MTTVAVVGPGKAVFTVPAGMVVVPAGLVVMAVDGLLAGVLTPPAVPLEAGAVPLGMVRVREVSCTPGIPAALQVFANSAGAWVRIRGRARGESAFGGEEGGRGGLTS